MKKIFLILLLICPILVQGQKKYILNKPINGIPTPIGGGSPTPSKPKRYITIQGPLNVSCHNASPYEYNIILYGYTNPFHYSNLIVNVQGGTFELSGTLVRIRWNCQSGIKTINATYTSNEGTANGSFQATVH